MSQVQFILRPLLAVLVLAAPGLAGGQTTPDPAQALPPVEKQAPSPRADAYYHFALGHYYEEMANAYGNKGEYLNQAIDNYKLALKEDPSASFLVEDIADLYRQAGRIREATAEAEEALKANPNDLNARRVLARIYTQLIGDAQANRIDERMVGRAIEQYRLVTDKDPKDVESLVMLGRLYKLNNNSPEAVAAYKKALAAEPGNEDALTGLAMTYSDQGNTQEATKLLEQLAKKDPSPRALAALGASYEQMREYELAANAYRQALALAPDRVELKRSLAYDLTLSNHFEEAIRLYKELAAADPKSAEPQLRLSQIYRQLHKFELARQAMDKAKEIEPDNLEVRYNEGVLLEAEGRTQDAIAALRGVLNATSKGNYNGAEKGYRATLLDRLGQLYRGAEQYDQAVDAFRQIETLDPDLGARAEAQVVDTYHVAKEYAKAQAAADAATKKYPDDRTLLAVRASLLADLGRSEQAAAELKRRLNGKNDRETYIALAQVYEKAKNYPEMERALSEAAKGKLSRDDQSTLHFMRGTMYERQKKYDQAEQEFRSVLSIDPENASAYNYLGYMFADRDVRLTEAHDLIERALTLDPNNGAFLDSLGWVFYKLNRLSEAEQQLTRSLQLVSRDPTIHSHLGDVYFKQGKTKEAIQQWQASLKEWDASALGERDQDEIAKVQHKLDGARTRFAKRQPSRHPNN